MLVILIVIFLFINIINCEDDECLYTNQVKDDCFKIPKNSLDEYCCYLEMDLNNIFTSACVRVKNNPDDITKKIFTIKTEEDNYKLENLNIVCISTSLFFPLFNILILFLLYIL